MLLGSLPWLTLSLTILFISFLAFHELSARFLELLVFSAALEPGLLAQLQ